MAKVVRLARRPKRPPRFANECEHFEGDARGDALAALASIGGTLQPLNDALEHLTPVQQGMAFQVDLAVLGQTIARRMPADGLDHSSCYIAEFMRGWETGIESAAPEPPEPEEKCPF
jgi:hypothetical protein